VVEDHSQNPHRIARDDSERASVNGHNWSWSEPNGDTEVEVRYLPAPPTPDGANSGCPRTAVATRGP